MIRLTAKAAITFILVPAASLAGGTFETIPTPAPGVQSGLRALATQADGTAWGVGFRRVETPPFGSDTFPLALRFDGAAWSQVALPAVDPEAEFNAVATLPDGTAWAGGSQRLLGADGFPGTQTLAMFWDGADWSIVETPLTPAGTTGAMIFDLLAISPDEVYAVGLEANLQAITSALALEWDGSEWTKLPIPPVVMNNQRLRAIDDLPGGGFIVVGGTSNNQPVGDQPYVATWDGSSWTFDSSAPAIGLQTFYNDVLVRSNGQIHVVGEANVGGRFQAFVATLDAGSWSVTPQGTFPDGSGFAAILETDTGEVWALGTHAFLLEGGVWNNVPLDPGAPVGVVLSDAAPLDAGAFLAGGRALDPSLVTHVQRFTPDALAADLDGDGVVGSSDLAILLASWGGSGAGDINGDGVVNSADLALLLADWG